MTFFKQDEFALLNETKGIYCDRTYPDIDKAYKDLSIAYNKVQYWTQEVKKKIFPDGVIKITKKPTSQANNFDGYLWAKLYPTNKDAEDKWLAITLGLDSEFHYTVKIDTVGLSKGVRFDYYTKTRGEYYNSQLVKRIKFDHETIIDWQSLIDFAIESINSFSPIFSDIKQYFMATQINKISKIANQPLNQILYGPPGTGKTFKLQQIIIDNKLIKTQDTTVKDYTSFVKQYTWWQIIALVLYKKGGITVPTLAQHPLILAKLGSSNVKSLNVRLWSSLQHHTVEHCPNVKYTKRMGEKVFYKEAGNSNWRLDSEELFKADYESLIEDYESFEENDMTTSKNLSFITCHQSLSYEDFIEGIKPRLMDESNDEDESGDLKYENKKGLFYEACEKAVKLAGFINLKDCLDQTKDERTKQFDKAISEGKVFYVFLDEINRCNVSSVFGELITLIEADKRLGKDYEMADLVLPYSQSKFGVPPNLYIIGTMNTADRSVEALDTALRRRFSFEELMPKPEKLAKIMFDGFSLEEILRTINERIELLLDRDHTIGHSYFIKINSGDTKALNDAFKNCIIPLLQEYFYHDYEKIALILGEGFVQLKESKAIKFAAFSKVLEKPESSNHFELIADVEDIEAAVLSLLNRDGK